MRDKLIDTRAIVTACIILVLGSMATNWNTVVKLEAMVAANTEALKRNSDIDLKQTELLNQLLMRRNPRVIF